ncbi:MAG: DinB family protein [Nocardioides sp.]
MERTERPVRADEAMSLRGFLDYHRDTFRMKCAGLTQAQLAQPLPPTDMTLGGMMKHLAIVDQSWFEDDFAGAGLMPPFDTVDWDADRDWEWHSAKDDSPEELLALFDEACRRSDAVLDDALAPGGVGLDGLSVAVDDERGRFSLRWILLHMIEEYARHNGHADLIRESIDGQTGQ